MDNFLAIPSDDDDDSPLMQAARLASNENSIDARPSFNIARTKVRIVSSPQPQQDANNQSSDRPEHDDDDGVEGKDPISSVETSSLPHGDDSMGQPDDYDIKLPSMDTSSEMPSLQIQQPQQQETNDDSKSNSIPSSPLRSNSIFPEYQEAEDNDQNMASDDDDNDNRSGDASENGDDGALDDVDNEDDNTGDIQTTETAQCIPSILVNDEDVKIIPKHMITTGGHDSNNPTDNGIPENLKELVQNHSELLTRPTVVSGFDNVATVPSPHVTVQPVNLNVPLLPGQRPPDRGLPNDTDPATLEAESNFLSKFNLEPYRFRPSERSVVIYSRALNTHYYWPLKHILSSGMLAKAFRHCGHTLGIDNTKSYFRMFSLDVDCLCRTGGANADVHITLTMALNIKTIVEEELCFFTQNTSIIATLWRNKCGYHIYTNVGVSLPTHIFLCSRIAARMSGLAVKLEVPSIMPLPYSAKIPNQPYLPYFLFAKDTETATDELGRPSPAVIPNESDFNLTEDYDIGINQEFFNSMPQQLRKLAELDTITEDEDEDDDDDEENEEEDGNENVNADDNDLSDMKPDANATKEELAIFAEIQAYKLKMRERKHRKMLKQQRKLQKLQQQQQQQLQPQVDAEKKYYRILSLTTDEVSRYMEMYRYSNIFQHGFSALQINTLGQVIYMSLSETVGDAFTPPHILNIDSVEIKQNHEYQQQMCEYLKGMSLQYVHDLQVVGDIDFSSFDTSDKHKFLLFLNLILSHFYLVMTEDPNKELQRRTRNYEILRAEQKKKAAEQLRRKRRAVGGIDFDEEIQQLENTDDNIDLTQLPPPQLPQTAKRAPPEPSTQEEYQQLRISQHQAKACNFFVYYATLRYSCLYLEPFVVALCYFMDMAKTQRFDEFRRLLRCIFKNVMPLCEAVTVFIERVDLGTITMYRHTSEEIISCLAFYIGNHLDPCMPVVDQINYLMGKHLNCITDQERIDLITSQGGKKTRDYIDQMITVYYQAVLDLRIIYIDPVSQQYFAQRYDVGRYFGSSLEVKPPFYQVLNRWIAKPFTKAMVAEKIPHTEYELNFVDGLNATATCMGSFNHITGLYTANTWLLNFRKYRISCLWPYTDMPVQKIARNENDYVVKHTKRAIEFMRRMEKNITKLYYYSVVIPAVLQIRYNLELDTENMVSFFQNITAHGQFKRLYFLFEYYPFDPKFLGFLFYIIKDFGILLDYTALSLHNFSMNSATPNLWKSKQKFYDAVTYDETKTSQFERLQTLKVPQMGTVPTLPITNDSLLLVTIAVACMTVCNRFVPLLQTFNVTMPDIESIPKKLLRPDLEPKSYNTNSDTMADNFERARRNIFGKINEFESDLLSEFTVLCIAANFQLDHVRDLIDTVAITFVPRNVLKKIILYQGPSNTGKSFLCDKLQSICKPCVGRFRSFSKAFARGESTGQNFITILNETRRLDPTEVKSTTGNDAESATRFYTQAHELQMSQSLMFGATNTHITFTGDRDHIDVTTVDRIFCTTMIGQYVVQPIGSLLTMAVKSAYFKTVVDIKPDNAPYALGWLAYAAYLTRRDSLGTPHLNVNSASSLDYRHRIFMYNNKVYRTIINSDLSHAPHFTISLEDFDAQIDSTLTKAAATTTNHRELTNKRDFIRHFRDQFNIDLDEPNLRSVEGFQQTAMVNFVTTYFKAKKAIGKVITANDVQRRLDKCIDPVTRENAVRWFSSTYVTSFEAVKREYHNLSFAYDLEHSLLLHHQHRIAYNNSRFREDDVTTTTTSTSTTVMMPPMGESLSRDGAGDLSLMTGNKTYVADDNPASKLFSYNQNILPD